MLALEILFPFKGGDDHATSIGENVGDHCDAAGKEHIICPWCRGTICKLKNDFYLDARRVRRGDLIFERGRDKHLGGQLEESFVGNFFRTAEAFKRRSEE